MQANRLISLTVVLAAVLALSACEASTPSQVNIGKILVKDQMAVETLDAGNIDQGRINAIADNFLRNGKSGIEITVPYLSGYPAGKSRAEKQGIAYKKSFERHGIAGISVVTVPVQDRQYADKVVVAYKSLAALPPAGCTSLPGSMGADNLDAADQYQFGCDTKATVARMIADPSDLLGKAGAQDGDSRRSGVIIEPYNAGKPNEPMKGFQASKIGSGG